MAPQIEENLALFGRDYQLELQEEENPQMPDMTTKIETTIPPLQTTEPRFRSDYTYVAKVDGWLKFHKSHVNWFDALTRCRLEGKIFQITQIQIQKIIIATLHTFLTQKTRKKERQDQAGQ